MIPTALSLDADFLALRKIGPWLHALLAEIGDERRTAVFGRIELAIHELATNSIEHGAPQDGAIHLSAEVNGTELLVVLRDNGVECDVSDISTPDPDDPQVRGYGMMIIEQVASSLDYERSDDNNVWTAIFAI